jgi:hypothetical protein
LTLAICSINVQTDLDPSFSWKDDDLGGAYFGPLQSSFLLILSILYSSYLVLITYSSLFQGSFNDMKKSYKFSILLTFGAIFGYLILLIWQHKAAGSST